MGLSGAYQFRKGLLGKTVLQVEEERRPFWSKSGEVKRRWRDAKAADLADPAIRFQTHMDPEAVLGLSARHSGGGPGALPRQREQGSGHRCGLGGEASAR